MLEPYDLTPCEVQARHSTGLSATTGSLGRLATAGSTAGAGLGSTARISRPAASAQNAAPMPRKVRPEAAMTKVIAGASRPSGAARAPDSDAESVASRASPATAPVTSAGAALRNVVTAAETRANTRYAQ